MGNLTAYTPLGKVDGPNPSASTSILSAADVAHIEEQVSAITTQVNEDTDAIGHNRLVSVEYRYDTDTKVPLSLIFTLGDDSTITATLTAVP